MATALDPKSHCDAVPLAGHMVPVAAKIRRELAVTADYRHLSETTALFIACFGAQAILCGLFICFSRFTRWAFLAYGIALLPFFWFNYYFIFVLPIFNAWLSIDFVANLMMLWLCFAGWRAMKP
jgi:hypothetical protein